MNLPANAGNRRRAVFGWACIYAGDLIPYFSVFLITLVVGRSYGTAYAADFNLVYSYVAMVLALFAAPGMISLKRKLAHAESSGDIMMAGFIIRLSGVLLGATTCWVYFLLSPQLAPLLWIFGLVLLARVLETSVDIPAIVTQYRWSPFGYLSFRVTMLCVLLLVLAAFHYALPGFYRLLSGYVVAAVLAFSLAAILIRRYWRLDGRVCQEAMDQLQEIRPMFLAVCVYVASTRLYVVVIGEYLGRRQAADFATVQNITAVAGLLASAFAGLFFWSSNRLPNVDIESHTKSLWAWGLIAIVVGALLGGAVALASEWIVLRPLKFGPEMLQINWMICMATPLLAMQALVSNFLMLIKRDKLMFALALFSSLMGVLMLFLLVPLYGMKGAATVMMISPLLSVLAGVLVVNRETNHAHIADT
jgi:O-antigen/teichoic acid export membrane protein